MLFAKFAIITPLLADRQSVVQAGELTSSYRDLYSYVGDKNGICSVVLLRNCQKAQFQHDENMYFMLTLNKNKRQF